VSAPSLPPPPGSPSWAPVLPTEPEAARRPPWRQGRPGWVLLHVLIAFGIAVAGFFVATIAGTVGRTQADLDNADDGMFALGFLVLVAGSVAGWILFAYMDASLGRRWVVLGTLVGVSVVIASVTFSAATS
jgi:hypothetical protein